MDKSSRSRWVFKVVINFSGEPKDRFLRKYVNLNLPTNKGNVIVLFTLDGQLIPIDKFNL